MTPNRSVVLDGGTLFELIKVWDHRCETPAKCPHPDGAVTRFAARIGRHPQTLWNLPNGKRASATLANAIAGALGVEVGRIIWTDETPPARKAA